MAIRCGAILLGHCLLAALAGCTASSSQDATPAQTAAPGEAGEPEESATLPSGRYTTYCLVTPGATDTKRADLLAVPASLEASQSEQTSREGWPTANDVVLTPPRPGADNAVCEDHGYFTRKSTLQIKGDGEDRRMTITIWDKHSGGTREDRTFSNLKLTRSPCFAFPFSFHWHPAWYEAVDESGSFHFFVFMEKGKESPQSTETSPIYYQKYRVEIFRTDSAAGKKCYDEERPEFGRTVRCNSWFYECPTYAHGQQNGVGAGNEPLRPSHAQ